MKWNYKGTGMDEKIQFRAYDLNNVDFSNVQWKNLKDSKVITEFTNRYVAPYAPGTRKNQVLVASTAVFLTILHMMLKTTIIFAAP